NFDGGAYVSAVDSHDAVAGVGHWVHGPNPLDIDQFERISGDAPGVSGLAEWVNPVARHSNYIMVDPVTGQPSGALHDIARIVAGVEP
ncbi:hypothetical protein, partial [Schaalia suimastitidis]|uniref:hypothetical protein n=1 Tax=Schaalia suimastitidis TaxID=121163 RepID=UPI000557805B